MSRFYATISHHSISRAREVDVGNDLTKAMALADEEFGGDFNDYVINIYDRERDDGYAVMSRKMDGEWPSDDDSDGIEDSRDVAFLVTMETVNVT